MDTNGITLVVIPARSGSKRLPGKNIKPLAGIPLIGRTIQTALDTRGIDKVIVSTDSEDIQRVAVEYGAEVPFMRPDELATDEASSWDMLRHAVRHEQNSGLTISTVILLQTTSPFTTPQMIQQCLEKLQTTSLDAVITVRKVHPGVEHMYSLRGDVLTPCVESPHPGETLVPSGNVYCYSVATLFKEDQTARHNSIGAVHVTDIEAIDIDEQLDFDFAEFIINQKTS